MASSSSSACPDRAWRSFFDEHRPTLADLLIQERGGDDVQQLRPRQNAAHIAVAHIQQYMHRRPRVFAAQFGRRIDYAQARHLRQFDALPALGADTQPRQ